MLLLFAYIPNHLIRIPYHYDDENPLSYQTVRDLCIRCRDRGASARRLRNTWP
jgi:hypothetical protein